MRLLWVSTIVLLFMKPHVVVSSGCRGKLRSTHALVPQHCPYRECLVESEIEEYIYICEKRDMNVHSVEQIRHLYQRAYQTETLHACLLSF